MSLHNSGREFAQERESARIKVCMRHGYDKLCVEDFYLSTHHCKNLERWGERPLNIGSTDASEEKSASIGELL